MLNFLTCCTFIHTTKLSQILKTYIKKQSQIKKKSAVKLHRDISRLSRYYRSMLENKAKQNKPWVKKKKIRKKSIRNCRNPISSLRKPVGANSEYIIHFQSHGSGIWSGPSCHQTAMAEHTSESAADWHFVEGKSTPDDDTHLVRRGRALSLEGPPC